MGPKRPSLTSTEPGCPPDAVLCQAPGELPTAGLSCDICLNCFTHQQKGALCVLVSGAWHQPGPSEVGSLPQPSCCASCLASVTWASQGSAPPTEFRYREEVQGAGGLCSACSLSCDLDRSLPLSEPQFPSLDSHHVQDDSEASEWRRKTLAQRNRPKQGSQAGRGLRRGRGWMQKPIP